MPDRSRICPIVMTSEICWFTCERIFTILRAGMWPAVSVDLLRSVRVQWKPLDYVNIATATSSKTWYVIDSSLCTHTSTWISCPRIIGEIILPEYSSGPLSLLPEGNIFWKFTLLSTRKLHRCSTLSSPHCLYGERLTLWSQLKAAVENGIVFHFRP